MEFSSPVKDISRVYFYKLHRKETVFNQTTRVMAAPGHSTNVYIASYFSWCCRELLNPTGVIVYKLCLKKLLKGTYQSSKTSKM